MDRVNAMSCPDFTAAFGNALERCPLAAATAWATRPFAGLEQLLAAFTAFLLHSLPPDAQDGLLRCYPELATDNGGELHGGSGGSAGDLGLEPFGGEDGDLGPKPSGREDEDLGLEPSGGEDGDLGLEPFGGQDGDLGPKPSGGEDGDLGLEPFGGEDGVLGLEPSEGEDGDLGLEPFGGSAGDLGPKPSGGEDGDLGLEPFGGSAGDLSPKPSGGEDGDLGLEPSGGSAGDLGPKPSVGEDNNLRPEPSVGEDDDSAREHASAGTALRPRDVATRRRMGRACRLYRERFGFPLVLCVRRLFHGAGDGSTSGRGTKTEPGPTTGIGTKTGTETADEGPWGREEGAGVRGNDGGEVYEEEGEERARELVRLMEERALCPRASVESERRDALAQVLLICALRVADKVADISATDPCRC